MDKNVLYKMYINNDYNTFKRSLKEDLEKEFNLLINKEKKMSKKIICENISEILDRMNSLKRSLRLCESDTDEVKNKVEKAESVMDGDEDDDVKESLKEAKRRMKEAEDEIEDIKVDEDDEEEVEKLKEAYSKIRRIKALIEETEDEVDDEIKENKRKKRMSEEDDEDDEEEIKESRRLRKRRMTEDEEIEGSTDDVKESLRTINRKLREAEDEVKNVEKEDEKECVESCKNAYSSIKYILKTINHVSNLNINESDRMDCMKYAKKISKIQNILEKVCEDDVEDDEIKEACLNFKKAITKCIRLVEEDTKDEEDINESVSLSLIKRMNRFL